MSSRAIVLLIVLVVVGFTIMSLREYFTHEPEAPKVEIAEKHILVAKRNLVSGAFIDVQQDLDWAPEPKQENATEAKTENPDAGATAPVANGNYQYEGSVRIEDFAGAVVRRSIRAGEPITPLMLMKSGEGGFMSAVLEPGKRAVSISVNPISGNAGFVSPGDRVDLLITYRVKNAKNPDSGVADSIATETFASNVRVLAVDQSLDNPDNKAILAKTITVEVTPSQAEKISVASELGKISVSLVGNGVPTVVAKDDKGMDAENTVPSDAQGYTIDGDVSSLIEQKESSMARVKVIRADKTEMLEFYQEKQ